MIFVDFIYFRSFSPLFFLSQSLVFVTVVFIILGRCSLPVHVVFLLLVCQYSAYCLIVFSFSFVSCSWCYWVFFFVCNYAVIATDCSHDNSYLSMEYNNGVPLIDHTMSINTSSRRKYRKRYIDNFNLLMKKNSHYKREVNKLILGTIYHILPQMLILKHYDYYRRTSW